MSTGKAADEPVGRASVCMATYNGQAYLKEQVASILAQLGPDDELIVVDDASQDGTVALLLAFQDTRIRLVKEPVNRGYVKCFERAVLLSTGKYILLSDQDDVWMPGRLELLVTRLQDHGIVASNFELLGSTGPFEGRRLRASDSGHPLRNIFAIMIGYRPYLGCAMALRRDVLDLFAPMPSYLHESHDLWLALTGNVSGELAHIEEPTLLRRLHDNNVTPRRWRSLPTILRARLMLFRALLEAVRRRGNHNRASFSHKTI